jgi:hypothetical protein
MSTAGDRQFVEALLTALGPYLSADARKSSAALKGILDLFPGQPLAEVQKTIQALLASSRTSVLALAERARALLSGSAQEFVDDWMADVARLSSADLKRLGRALGLELSGAKARNVDDLQRWVESGGKVAPATAKDRARAEAARLAGDLPERMRALDGQTAAEVIRRAEAASKELSKEAFTAFGELLGIAVSGSKPKMLQQIRDFVDHAAVIQQQTQF